MCNKRSSGFDGVPVKVLKSMHSEILKPLSHLINLSVISGTIPECLKLATIFPIHKKRDYDAKENYRPISLLSTFSKIFEQIVYNRLIEYLSKNKLLADTQHGFRSRRSTETASFRFMQFIHSKIDQKQHVAALFFDLSKAQKRSM
ncbi:MAG: reverse transcriptase domain-containing protein [Burkholderia gladioli]